MNKILAIPAWIASIVLLASCSGGSSSAPQQSSAIPEDLTNPSREQPATVALLLTDASADDYDHAYATITGVELVGDSGSQTIFSGSQTVDLLSLRKSLQIFAVNENVTPGDFDKIRIHATDLVLVVDNDDGSTTEAVVELIANGKIDLNPREKVSIDSGDIAFVSFDWDVHESLKLTRTGNGKTIMRPVIFVDVGTEPAFKNGLVRIGGQIELLASDFASFRLCSPEGSIAQPIEPVLNDMCLDIIVDENTGLFDKKGLPIMVDGLEKGASAMVVGILRRSIEGIMIAPTDDEGNDVVPTPFQVTAIVVEQGEVGTWGRLRGSLSSSVDGMDRFDFALEAGQGYADGTVLTGQLFHETRILRIAADTGLTTIDPGDLAINDVAVVEAVTVPAELAGDPDVLRIAIMLAATPVAGLDSVNGEILSLDDVAGTISLSGESAFSCVTADGDTSIFVLTLSDDSLESVAAAFEDLAVGARIFVAGADDGAGCFAADLIIQEGSVVEAP